MYVLVAGNPWDGMTVYVSADGHPFESVEEAEKAFMLDERIGSDYWETVPVKKVQESTSEDPTPMSETDRVEAQWDIEDASKP